MTHQLPSYSPLTPAGLSGAAADAALRGRAISEALESDLAQRFRACRAIAVGSGTQALQLALLIADEVRRAAPVALPGYACYDLVSAAVGARTRVRFYDIDPTSLTPDPVSLQGTLDRGVGAMVAAYLYGFPIDWDVTREACRRAEAVLIEDAAQGIGSAWGSVEAGCHGDLVVLSFGRGKGWTGGGGGALLVRDERLAAAFDELSLSLMAPGRLAGPRSLILAGVQWALGRPSLYALPTAIPGLRLGETVYKEPTMPTRLSPTNAAIARRHGELALRESAIRRERAVRWRAALAGVACVEVCDPLARGTSGYLRFPLRLRSARSVDSIVGALADRGIARGYPLALPALPAVDPILAEPRMPVPGAEILARELVTAPTHSLVDDAELEATVQRLVMSTR